MIQPIQLRKKPSRIPANPRPLLRPMSQPTSGLIAIRRRTTSRSGPNISAASLMDAYQNTSTQLMQA